MDRWHELEVIHRSTAMVPPGQLAMRREVALQVLEELIDALRRLAEIRRALEVEDATSLSTAPRLHGWQDRSVPADDMGVERDAAVPGPGSIGGGESPDGRPGSGGC